MSQHLIAGFFVRNTSLWRQLVLLLTFTINIIILASWDADVNYTERKPVTPDWCVHTCVSLCRCGSACLQTLAKQLHGCPWPELAHSLSTYAVRRYDEVLLILGILHIFVAAIMFAAYLLSFPLRNPLDLNQPVFDHKVIVCGLTFEGRLCERPSKVWLLRVLSPNCSFHCSTRSMPRSSSTWSFRPFSVAVWPSKRLTIAAHSSCRAWTKSMAKRPSRAGIACLLSKTSLTGNI